MARRSLSSLKRLRQNARRAARNKTRKSALKTQLRKVRDAIAARDANVAAAVFREAAKLLDRTAAHRTIHPNTAARRKSRLARKINALAKK